MGFVRTLVLCLALGFSSAAFADFDAYLNEFGKSYTPAEYRMRRALYIERVAEILKHNANPKKTFTMGINKFTDSTDAELAQLRGFNMGQWRSATEHMPRMPFIKSSALPDSFDWRDEGMVTPVKNQASCGSCWAFSGVGALEANLLINGQAQTILSEQQYVDCVPNPDECGGTGGCNGATQPLLFNYSLTHGAKLESDYVYTATTNTCVEDNYETVVSVEGYGILPENCDEDTLKSYLVKQGPIAISVDASKWSAYSGGVLTYDECGADIDHAVLLVGYGTDADYGDYWTIKNSWSSSWGESGYIRISREDGYTVDSSPSDGTGCADGPDSVEVRGTCGIYYANSYVYGAMVSSA